MAKREQVLTILQKTFPPDDAHKILEYIDSRIPDNVATQRDIYEIKLEIEKLRANLTQQIEKIRADLTRDIEQSRADLNLEIANVRSEIEKLRGEVAQEIEKLRLEGKANNEKLRAELVEKIEKVRSETLRWSFAFWITQMVLLAGILFKLLS